MGRVIIVPIGRRLLPAAHFNNQMMTSAGLVVVEPDFGLVDAASCGQFFDFGSGRRSDQGEPQAYPDRRRCDKLNDEGSRQAWAARPAS
jgi:hypothetical protein